MTKSPRNFYVFKNGWRGRVVNLNSGLGAGAYIIEIIMSLHSRCYFDRTAIPFSLSDLASGTQRFDIRNSALAYYEYWINDTTGLLRYPIYKSIMQFDVLTIITSGAGAGGLYVDGQKLINTTLSPNLSGNLDLYVGALAAIDTHNICGLRLWNPATLSAGWEDEVRKRAVNPWDRSPIFTDAALKLEYLLDSNIPAISLVIPNSANPGVGDLTITPAAAWSTVRKAWRTP